MTSKFTRPSSFLERRVLDDVESTAVPSDGAAADLRRQLEERDVIVSRQKREIEDLDQVLNKVRRELVEEGDFGAESSEASTFDFREATRRLALELLGEDPVFGQDLKTMAVDTQFPAKLCKLVERHLLRKQRNIAVHCDKHEHHRTREARAFFCLFGASLLLPRLPEAV